MHRWPTRPRLCLAVAFGWGLCVLLGSPREAAATDLNGKWSASSLRVSWSVGDWGETCGPRPSGGGEAGGTVTLTQSGSDFKWTGAGRSYSSTQCWEQMPGLSPRGHSAGSATIQTTCKMPAGDPRQATVITTWYPRGDQLYFDETGQYQLLSKGSNCTASVRRTRLLTRVVEKTEPAEQTKPVEKTPSQSPTPSEAAKEKQGAEAAKAEAVPIRTTELETTGPRTNAPHKSVPAVEPPPPPTQADHCQEPGAPVELEVLPKSKLMRKGESFAFQALARDAGGCRVPVQTTFRLVSGAGGDVSPTGVLQISPQASSGTLTLEASVADQKVTVSARVVSESEYDELLAGGQYGVMGESLDGATITLRTSHVELESGATDESQKNRLLLALLGALLLLGTGVAFWALRRARPPTTTAQAAARSALREALADEDAPEAAAEPKAKPKAEVAVEVPPTPAPPPRLCPVCGRRYEDGTLFCGEDGARLVRAN